MSVRVVRPAERRLARFIAGTFEALRWFTLALGGARLGELAGEPVDVAA